jgi:hypothetical protein
VIISRISSCARKPDGNTVSRQIIQPGRPIHILTKDGVGNLCAGGSFSTAGTNVSAFVAEENAAEVIAEPW